MADITMCQRKNCPLNHKCKRFIAIPNEYWQSYFEPKNQPNERCKYYLEASKSDKEKYKKYVESNNDAIQSNENIF